MPNRTHPYFDQLAVLTSKHHKLNLVRSKFDEFVGLRIVEAELDTDQLGTFTGEIERKFPPLETAIYKARLGMHEEGLPIGLASEGSIGPDPLVPFLVSDIESIVLIDDEREIVVSEVFRSFKIIATTTTIYPGQELGEFLSRANFPNHKLIVRPVTTQVAYSVKGISTISELELAIALCAKESPEGTVVIESDLRADNSPSRQRNIEHVAGLLAARVSQLCPECQMPGWGRVSYKRGLHCRSCSSYLPDALKQEMNGCVKCDHMEAGKVVAELVEPLNCPWCNP